MSTGVHWQPSNAWMRVPGGTPKLRDIIDDNSIVELKSNSETIAWLRGLIDAEVGGAEELRKILEEHINIRITVCE